MNRLVLIVMVMTSCSEIIEFDSEGSPSQLVIFGTLTNSSNAPNDVNVSYTSVRDTIQPEPNAEVLLYEESEIVQIYRYDENSRRYLPTDDNFMGIPGRSYFLEVRISENIYRSVPEKLPVKTIQDSITFGFGKRRLTSNQGVTIEQPIIEIFASGEVTDATEMVYLKWDVEEIFVFREVVLVSFNFPFYSPGNCYVVQPYVASELPLFRSDEANKYHKRLVVEPIDRDFKGFHAFGIVQSSMTANAYNYWQQIEKASNRIPTIFETPPGPVRGNIFNIDNDKDRPLGYFAAVKVDSATIGTTEKDLPVFLPGDAPPGGCNIAVALQSQVPFSCFQCLINEGVPEACIDCTVLPGSTRERPSYLEN